MLSLTTSPAPIFNTYITTKSRQTTLSEKNVWVTTSAGGTKTSL
jgi:hypothetical protein